MNNIDNDSTERMIAASTVDQIQAMHSVLCYLCANNLENDEVVLFLKLHPESLLLEGTSPTDSARKILEMHMRKCKCFGTGCNENRRKLLHSLARGFEFYQGLHLDVIHNAEAVSQDRTRDLNTHTSELCRLEHQIRELQFDEIAIQNAILDATLQRRTFRDELQKMKNQEKLTRRPLARLACGRNGDMYAQRSVLEYYMEMESAKIAALEKKQAAASREISFSHQMQLALLKKIFGGCRRHVCATLKRITPKK